MTPPAALSDPDLLVLLKTGDREAYTVIYDRYIFVLLNHAFNKLRDREEARDLVQEVFAQLWTRREELDKLVNLSGYLYTALRNKILNRFAHQGVKQRYVDSLRDFAELGQVEADHLVRERQLAELIEQEIAALPSKMREVFEMSRREHLSHKEIAERLNISELTVNKQVSNALKILRFRLGIMVYLLWLV